jgi:hypothetical protein
LDTKLSRADTTNEEELDEEFDTFPLKKTGEVVRRRYDRLRSIGGRMQTVLGDLATQGERAQSLLSWQDPRATAIFVCFSLIAVILTYFIPNRLLIILAASYVLRPPRLVLIFLRCPKTSLKGCLQKQIACFDNFNIYS